MAFCRFLLSRFEAFTNHTSTSALENFLEVVYQHFDYGFFGRFCFADLEFF